MGRYTRIGNRVIANTRIATSAYTAGTGNTQQASYPLTSNNTTNSDSESVIHITQTTFGASVSYYVANLPANSTTADLVGIVSGGAAVNLAAASWTTSSNMIITMSYGV